jgi:PAS domain S-box-containing protein
MLEAVSHPTLHDYPTLFFASGIVGGTLLTLLAMEARKSYPGLVLVIVGLLLRTTALLIAGLAGYSPDALWILQVTFIIAYALVNSGIRLFCAMPHRGRWPYAYVLASILLLTYLYFTSSVRAQIVFTSLVLIPIYVDAALPLLRTPPMGRAFGYRFTAMIFMMFCATLCVRIVAVSLLPSNASPFFATTHANTVYFYLALFLQIAFMFGIISLTHERVVSELKSAHERIRVSEQRYRSLVRASSQLVWTCDGDGYLRHELEDWQLFTGQTSEQVRGLGWLNAIHPEDRDKTLKAAQHAIETKSIYAVENRLRRSDGAYRIMQARAVPVLDSTGQVIEWVGMCIDVTEQRLAEERLRRNEKLAVAGRLALNISHEINNPLAGTTNLVYLIGSDPGLSKTTRTFVTMAEQELARASQAVSRNLRFANTSSRAGDADLGELTDSVTEFFQSRFETDHIAVERDYRTKARVRCYPHELQDVIANLLSNAHDAMRRGGKLKIRIRETRAWNDVRAEGLRLTIADTGTGIAPDLKHKVFEPFFTTKEETGAGLGLWVSREIVHKHHGRLAFRSSTDPKHPGTVFSLFFPFQNAVPMNKAQEQSSSLPFAAD